MVQESQGEASSGTAETTETAETREGGALSPPRGQGNMVTAGGRRFVAAARPKMVGRADPARRAHGGEGSRRPTIDTTIRANPARRAAKILNQTPCRRASVKLRV